jgi:hypothetical protein
MKKLQALQAVVFLLHNILDSVSHGFFNWICDARYAKNRNTLYAYRISRSTIHY